MLAVPSDLARSLKTTVDLPKPLLRAARALAARKGTTLRALVEEGLRWALSQQASEHPAFKLRLVTFAGKGLQPGIEEGSWEQIRDLIYQGRGGS